MSGAGTSIGTSAGHGADGGAGANVGPMPSLADQFEEAAAGEPAPSAGSAYGSAEGRDGTERLAGSCAGANTGMGGSDAGGSNVGGAGAVARHATVGGMGDEGHNGGTAASEVAQRVCKSSPACSASEAAAEIARASDSSVGQPGHSHTASEELLAGAGSISAAWTQLTLPRGKQRAHALQARR